MSSDREFIVEVIQLYKQLPCLWKRTDPYYCDKNKREVALEQLVDLYKTKYADADKDFVLKKIFSMRGSYRKEYNKVKASLIPRTIASKVHIPKLWYYNLLTFLEDQNFGITSGTVGSTLNNMPFGYDEGCEEDSSEATNVPVDQKVVPVNIDCEEDSNESADDPSASGCDTRWLRDSYEPRTTPQLSKRPSQRSKVDEILAKIARNMDESLERQAVIKQKHDSYGEYVAEKLRSFQPNMAIYCQKIINDSIFLAETGNLNFSSKIVTSMSNSSDINSVTSEYVSDVDASVTQLE